MSNDLQLYLNIALGLSLPVNLILFISGLGKNDTITGLTRTNELLEVELEELNFTNDVINGKNPSVHTLSSPELRERGKAIVERHIRCSTRSQQQRKPIPSGGQGRSSGNISSMRPDNTCHAGPIVTESISSGFTRNDSNETQDTIIARDTTCNDSSSSGNSSGMD